MMNYPNDEPKIRFSRIREAMREKQLDVLVVYSCQWKIEALHYVSNFRLLGEDACMVLPLEGEPQLLISQPWDAARARRESWVDEIVVAPDQIMFKAGQFAASFGKNVGLVGLEIMTARKYADLEKALNGIKPANAFSLLDEAAKVKTAWEVELMRKCAGLADLGYLAEKDALRVGVSEFELIAEIEYAMKKNGADENFQMIGMGRNLPSMNRAKENYLQVGDFVLTEITPLMGCITYATQLCRTVKMGPATPLEREKHKLLCDALEYALSKTKAGVRAKDIAIWQNEVIGAAGYEKYCHPPFMRSRGHNFGMGHIELSEDNDEILKTDMILVVHPNQMIPEIGYLVCGETIRITDDGVERFSKLSPQMFEAIPS